jgi:hypothetical protein
MIELIWKGLGDEREREGERERERKRGREREIKIGRYKQKIEK